MNKSVIYFAAFFQVMVFSVYASDKYVLSYNNVKDEHKVHIQASASDVFSHEIASGKVKPLLGGMSGDGLYVIELNPSKFVLRCMKQPYSVEWCQKDCQYSRMAAEKGLGPKVVYENLAEGCYAIEFVDGAHLSPAHLEDKQILEQFTCALRTIHNGSVDSQVKFDIFKRIDQKIKSNIQKNPEFSIELHDFLDEVYKINTAIKKHTIEPKACHNDIHVMNLFYTSEKTIKFIDWGNAGLGDPFWDIACSVIKFHFSKEQVGFFLEKYFENNISSADRAHFILIENVALLSTGLNFLAIKQEVPSAAVKAAVSNYLRKTNEEMTSSMDTFEDIAKICFALFKKRAQSQEYKEAFLLLEQL